MSTLSVSPFQIANIRLFILFRILFNARFYYPVFTVLFLDFGLSLQQFAILNSIWAATIVCLEVPSGALADTLGRRNLLRIAAALMFLEMASICFLPLGNNSIVFWGFAVNRILSGAAEAAASGADEALAYDSLEQAGLSKSWSQVLAFLMRWQSVAFICALLIGSFTYDSHTLNTFFGFMGIKFELSAQTTMRFPLYLVLLSSIGTLLVTYQMQEVAHGSENYSGVFQKCKNAILKMSSAVKWIAGNPFPLAVIAAGFLFDNVIRMVMTLNSQYFRTISLPSWSYGILGAIFSLLGFFVPTIAAKLAQHYRPLINFAILSAIAFSGLYGMTLVLPIYGLLPFGLVYSVMYFVGFMTSNYLNQVTPSAMRATVLSFKGLAFNLAYGLIGILYGCLTDSISIRLISSQPQLSQESLNNQAFTSALQYFPWYFLVTLVVFGATAYCLKAHFKSRHP